MTIKRILFRATVRLLEKVMNCHKITHCYSKNLSLNANINSNNVDLITIAFNNDLVIELQIEYLRRYVQDEFSHIVCDNSSDSEKSENIRKICEENNVAYLRLPKNHLNIIGPSYSHAAALNYVYRNVVSKRIPKYFGFIDHDLFPIAPISIAQYLQKQPCYGAKRQRGDFWYLSAIMSFFSTDFLKNRKVDFMPIKPDGKTYLDSGGGNWTDIYSKLDLGGLCFASERMEDFRPGGNRHSDQIEIFDNVWLHTINGSYWKEVQSKDSLIENILHQYEKHH